MRNYVIPSAVEGSCNETFKVTPRDSSVRAGLAFPLRYAPAFVNMLRRSRQHDELMIANPQLV
jgi:hypothetical protein